MDDFETALTEALSSQATRTEVPPVDAQALVVTARGELRRRRLHHARVVVAGAAAVALVAVGTTLGVRWSTTGEGEPAMTAPTTFPKGKEQPGHLRLTDLPKGQAPDLPYWIHGYLHLGSDQIAMPMPQILSANGVSLIDGSGPRYGDGLYLVRGDALQRLSSRLEGQPVISHDGRYGAWEESTDGPLNRIVLWDLETDKLTASKDFHSAAHCCDAPSVPVGIDDSGAVYIWDGGHPLVWRNALGRVEPIVDADHGADLTGAWPGGPVFALTRAETARSAFGTIDQSAAFSPAGRFPAQEGEWAPASPETEESVAFRTNAPSVKVLQVQSRRAVTMQLPEGWYNLLTWEDADHLLLQSKGRSHTYVLRCDATTGRCEVAQTFAVGLDSVSLPQE